MKIEPNKFYKTRSGLKARVYAVDGGGIYPIHGAVLNSMEWEFRSWTREGLNYSDGKQSVLGIVEEWTEPKPKLKAWYGPTGGVILRVEDLEDKSYWTRAPHLDEP